MNQVKNEMHQHSALVKIKDIEQQIKLTQYAIELAVELERAVELECITVKRKK